MKLIRYLADRKIILSSKELPSKDHHPRIVLGLHKELFKDLE